MIVTSNKSLRIPKLNFGITAGEKVELPKDMAPKAIERILQEPDITVVEEGAPASVQKNQAAK